MAGKSIASAGLGVVLFGMQMRVTYSVPDAEGCPDPNPQPSEGIMTCAALVV